MSVRRWHIDQALRSFVDLNRVLGELTSEEVTACLEIEAGTRRRRSVIDRLISRAIRLAEINLSRQLKEKYHGTPRIENHEPR